MDEEFPALQVAAKSGEEVFRMDGEPTEHKLLDFWRWSGSDLLSNTMRGILAEYIVGLALGVTSSGTRREWDAADLVTGSGRRVEVKSAAYLQTWAQSRLSKITFGINATTGWDAATNTFSDRRERQAHVYVFAVLEHKEKLTVDPLDLDQWVFHVLPTARLNEEVPLQRAISLARLLTLQPETVRFSGLDPAVSRAES